MKKQWMRCLKSTFQHDYLLDPGRPELLAGMSAGCFQAAAFSRKMVCSGKIQGEKIPINISKVYQEAELVPLNISGEPNPHPP